MAPAQYVIMMVVFSRSRQVLSDVHGLFARTLTM
jgi:hypothetical protein